MKNRLTPAFSVLASLLLIFGGLMSVNIPTSVMAQDEPVAEEAPAEPAPEQPAATPDDTPSETADAPESSNFLMWMINASGFFGAILLLLSFVMVALIVMNILQVNRSGFLPDDFVEDFEQRLAGKDFQGAYELAKNDDSVLARVLTSGLGRLNRGYAAAVEGMEEVGEEENMGLDHKLSYLSLIASIAPMIGLMGTVYGMILSFQKIAGATVAPKPKELAEGISTALFTTLEGLAVAIPAMIAYSLLKNRVARMMMEVGTVSENLMSQFSAVGKTKPTSES